MLLILSPATFIQLRSQPRDAFQFLSYPDLLLFRANKSMNPAFRGILFRHTFEK